MSGELIICTINGEEVFCEEGWTILQAAASIHVEIPMLCYHPEISIIGSCRICSVEVEGERELFTACSTPVKNGMSIRTDSEKVKKARTQIIELILSQHMADCMTCDASGECLLEKYAYDFGATGALYQKNQFDPRIHSVDDQNPLILLDRRKCILCGRCVRVCDEWVHSNAISFVNKGNKLMVSTLYNQGLETNKECIFCGNCITVCPVGALSEKNAQRKGRLPEVQKINTICPYCAVGCGMTVYKKGSRIIKVRGNQASPVSHGRLCIKGKFGLDFVNSKDRLLKPLVRNDAGELVETELIDALLMIERKIDEIKVKKGQFAGLASARCTNEDNYLFQKFFRAILNSDHIDHCARICHAPSVNGLLMTLGSGAMTNPIEDIDHIDCFFVIGSNMTATHPVIAWKIIRRIRQGAILILVDPKKSPLSRYATLQLQLNPGSDQHLLSAMMKMIIEENLCDFEMLENRTEGFGDLQSSLEKLSLDELIGATGLNENDVRLASRLFAISGSSSIYYAMGVTQHEFGTANVITLSNFALICGKIGTGYTGINPLRGQNNVQGSTDMGCVPGLLPGYQKLMNEKNRDFFYEKWNDLLPAEPGYSLTEIISRAGEGEIDFLYIMGENPVLSDPDVESVKKALDNTGFLVVQDLFLTETARYADVVLPVASFAEKDGTFTNTERRIQRVNKIIDPPSPQVLPDWAIINQLAQLCKADWNYHSWIDIFEEIRECVPIYSHIRPDDLERHSYFWPADENGESVIRLHQKDFNGGKAKIIFQKPEKTYTVSNEYPFLLIIGRIYEQYHTGTMTRRSKGIEALKPEPELLINPKDALHLKVKNNDRVRVSSVTGSVEIGVRISLDVKQGNLYTTFHYHESPVNRLTSKKNLDPQSQMAPMKIVSVKIEKINHGQPEIKNI